MDDSTMNRAAHKNIVENLSFFYSPFEFNWIVTFC